MEKEKLKQIAAREITAGIRRAAVLRQQAEDEINVSRLMPDGTRIAMHLNAQQKKSRAKRIMQIVGRLAIAHGITPNRKGRRCNSGQSSTTHTSGVQVVYKRRISDAS